MSGDATSVMSSTERYAPIFHEVVQSCAPGGQPLFERRPIYYIRHIRRGGPGLLSGIARAISATSASSASSASPVCAVNLTSAALEFPGHGSHLPKGDPSGAVKGAEAMDQLFA